MRHGYKDRRNTARDITLFIEGGAWMAKSAAFVDAFDTDTIPTACAGTVPALAVLTMVRGLNPGVTVSVRD